MFGNKPRMMPKANASHSKGRNYVTAMIFHNKPNAMFYSTNLKYPKRFQRFRINKLIIFVSRSRKCWRSIATRNGRHLNLNHQFTFVSSGYQSTVLAMHIHDLNLADDKSVCVCVWKCE